MKGKVLLLFIMVMSLFGIANAEEDVGIGSGGETIYYVKTVPQPNISITPTSLSFGNVEVTQSATLQVTVENTGPGTLDIGAVTSPAAPYAISGDTCSGQHLTQNETCTVIIRFSPVAAGNFNGNFNIPSNDPDTPTATVTLSGIGIVVPRISVSPNPANFSNVNIGSFTDIIVTVSSIGSGNLTLNSISSPAAPFTRAGGTCNNGSVMAPGGSCSITIRFTPTVAGAVNSSFSIISDAANSPNVAIDLQGNGVALPPSCTFLFSPNSVSAGNSSTFSWATANAVSGSYSCSGNLGSSALSPLSSGSLLATPAATQTCTGTVQNSSGQTANCSAVITVGSTPPSCNISFNPSSVNTGGTTTVSWSSSNASTINYSCTGDIGSGTLATLSGSTVVGPGATQSCTLTPYNASGQAGTSCAATVTVSSSAFACSQSFSPAVINNGDWTTFTRTHNAAVIGETVTSGTYSCTGNLGSGSITDLSSPLTGTWQVTQSQTCSTTLSTNTGKTATCSATITVNSLLPTCTASFNPNTVEQNSPTSFSWTSSNTTSLTYNCTVNFGSRPLSPVGSGSVSVIPNVVGTTTCTLTATNASGQSGTCQATLTVNPVGGGGSGGGMRYIAAWGGGRGAFQNNVNIVSFEFVERVFTIDPGTGDRTYEDRYEATLPDGAKAFGTGRPWEQMNETKGTIQCPPGKVVTSYSGECVAGNKSGSPDPVAPDFNSTVPQPSIYAFCPALPLDVWGGYVVANAYLILAVVCQ